MIRLVVTEGPGEGLVFDLNEGEYTAGRDDRVEVHLPSPRVSRKHALFQVQGGRVVVRDLGSSNGTLVNGHRMEACELVDGTLIQVGDVKLVFQKSESEHTVPVPPDPSEEQPTAHGEPPPAGFGASPGFGSFGGAPSESAPFGNEPGFGGQPSFGGEEPPLGAPPFGGAGAFGVDEPPPAAPFGTLNQGEPTGQVPEDTRPPPKQRSTSNVTPGPGPLARLPWNARLGLLLLFSGLLLLCGPIGGLASLVGAGGDGIEEMAALKGFALAEGLGHRNASALASRQYISLDTEIYADDPLVRKAWVADARGKVVAPAEKTNASLGEREETKDLWRQAEREGRTVAHIDGDGFYAIMTPVKASVGATKNSTEVGYAYLVYDAKGAADEFGKPTLRLVVSLFLLAVAGVVTGVGVYRMSASPVAALREETELAMKGHAAAVTASTNWGPLEDLAHSINRVLQRSGPSPQAGPDPALDTLLLACTFPVLVADGQLQVTAANDWALHLLQVPRETALGRNLLEIFGEPGVSDRLSAMIQQASTGASPVLADTLSLQGADKQLTVAVNRGPTGLSNVVVVIA